MSDSNYNRCPSKALIIPGVSKRCIRHEGHVEEDHVWVEDRCRVGNNPTTAYWKDGEEHAAIYEGVQISRQPIGYKVRRKNDGVEYGPFETLQEANVWMSEHNELICIYPEGAGLNE